MKKRTVKRTDRNGTEYTYHFDVDEENDHLRLTDITVKGASIIEMVSADVVQAIQAEFMHKWLMNAA